MEFKLDKFNFLKPSNKLEIIVDNKSYFCTIYYVENEKLTVFFDKNPAEGGQIRIIVLR